MFIVELEESAVAMNLLGHGQQTSLLLGEISGWVEKYGLAASLYDLYFLVKVVSTLQLHAV